MTKRNIDLGRVKAEIIENIKYYLEDNIRNALYDYEHNGFEYRYKSGYPTITKDYKFRPNIDGELIDKYEEKNASDKLYETIDFEIEHFAETLNRDLDERFEVELIIVGRSGGYWGISVDDAVKLVEVDENEVARKVEEVINDANFYSEATFDLDEESPDYEVENAMIDYAYDIITEELDENESYLEYLDTSKLEEVLEYIDNEITSGEAILNEYLREKLEEVE